MSFKTPSGCQVSHFPRKFVPMLDNPFSEGLFLFVQTKPSLSTSMFPLVIFYLEEETDPHFTTTFFQAGVESKQVSLEAKHPQLLQLLLIRLVLQRCRKEERMVTCTMLVSALAWLRCILHYLSLSFFSSLNSKWFLGWKLFLCAHVCVWEVSEPVAGAAESLCVWVTSRSEECLYTGQCMDHKWASSQPHWWVGETRYTQMGSGDWLCDLLVLMNISV